VFRPSIKMEQLEYRRTDCHESSFFKNCRKYYSEILILNLKLASLSLVSTTEELLGSNSSGSGLEGRGCRDWSR
jgi:hypothetical protein